MLVLWTVRVDGGDGKEIYGKDYSDIYAINRLHYKGASAYTCDHVSLFRGVLNVVPCGNRTVLEHACQKRNGKVESSL